MQCPFVYASGRRCAGTVRQARAYGKHRFFEAGDIHDIKKVRLWCSEKDDHAGFGREGKERMEFYPDELIGLGIYDEAIAFCENVSDPPRQLT